ncbi:MAG: regulatory protein RecX [Actinomycetaceae bacterium]|nr:regulatory protein RecX [Actinomycetaceae bacterium]
MAEKTEWEKARDIVTRQLAMMDRSRKQLLDALQRRGIDEEVSQSVLDWFAGHGLVDDEHFAEVLVRTRLAEKHASRRAIAEELRRKGVDREIIEKALDAIGEDEEYENALQVAMKKLRIASGNPATLRQRTYATLARRGFSPDNCYRALEDAAELLERQSSC